MFSSIPRRTFFSAPDWKRCKPCKERVFCGKYEAVGGNDASRARRDLSPATDQPSSSQRVGIGGESEARKKSKSRRGGWKLSEETRRKMSVARTGLVVSPQVRAKMSKAKVGKKKNAVTRLRMSKSHTGKTVSPDTREKISRGLKLAWEKRKRMDGSGSSSAVDDIVGIENVNVKGLSMDPLVMEKAVLEIGALKREMSAWLGQWFEKNDRKPTLDDVKNASPEIYNKFMRYIALRDFVWDS